MKPKQNKGSQPPIVYSPQAFQLLQRGFIRLADLLALTLGPNQGVIVNAREGKRNPEYLVESGTIARRVIQLPDRAEDAGAQILRAMVMEIHERYGDGAATASALAAAMLRKAAKLIAAGTNPMPMRAGIERGVAAAVKALEAQAQPAAGEEILASLATGVTGDEELGKILGEMFEVLGKDAGLIIEEFYSPYLEREYLDGGRWTSRPAARSFLPDGKNEVTLENPLVMVADHVLEKLAHVQPMLELYMRLGQKRSLLVVSQEVKGDALTTLLLNLNRGQINLAAIIPAANLFPMQDELADIALMAGSTVLCLAENRLSDKILPTDFGQARRAVFSRHSLTIVGGGGNPEALQKKIGELRAQMSRSKRGSPEWDKLRLRSARLAGGIGVLKIGAHTERVRELKKELAKKAVRMLDLAIGDGVLPGGGVAYLACQPAVQQARQACSNEDERCGVDLVASALEAPFLQLVKNFEHIHPPIALAEAQRLGSGYGLDVRTGKFVPMLEAGILDPLCVARGALQSAASAACMAITTDLIVLRERSN